MVINLRNADSKFQILAPAGSVEQLIAAVNNGCNAVYLGLDSFNARMKAANFTIDNLGKWVDYCHLYGVKVYVAINTSIKNDEFARAVQLLKNAYLLNADGVIVTDLVLMRIAASLPKPFEVVASTQLNVHDKYGAEFVKKCGASTVVCARECSFEQIRQIASTGINVECFLHGAMCVCQSGQCLFSSIVGGNSGNRGLCAQPCRKFYIADGASKSGYLLSAHDICGLDAARQLADCGVSTFKIEGRNRRPEYAGATSRVYSQLFENNFVKSDSDYTILAEMFNRAMTSNNYLTGSNSGIIYSAVQNHAGVAVGIVKKGKVATSFNLVKGDGLKVFDGDNEVCGGTVLENGTGYVRAQFSDKVSDGMQVHRTTSVALCDNVLNAKRKLPVSVKLIAKVGQKPQITAKCNDAVVNLEGDFVVQSAINKPVTCEEIASQLQKTGETYYTICDIATELDNIFTAKSQINALRRNVLDKLTQKIIEDYNLKFAARKKDDIFFDNILLSFEKSNSELLERKISKSSFCCVVCRNEHELSQASGCADYLIYKPEVIDIDSFKTANKYAAFIDLPSFADLNYIFNLLNACKVGLVCNNVGQIELARELNIDYIAGSGLNIFNDYIANNFADAKTFIYSHELTLREIGSFNNKTGLTFVDGQLPLMQLCHCPYKVAFDCNCSTCKAKCQLVYRDELGNSFRFSRRQAGRCFFELINGNKLSVVNKLKNAGRYVIDFDVDVLNHYLNLNNGIIDEYKELKPYTKGRLYDKIN